MTPDRIRGFVRKPPTGAKRLQLCHETVGGNEALADWTRDELEGVADRSGRAGEEWIEDILAQCQDVADTEQAPYSLFKLRWLGDKDRVLKVVSHRAKPNPVHSDDDGPTMELAPMVSAASASPVMSPHELSVWVPALLRQIVEKDKQMNAAYQTALDGNDRTIKMLISHNEKLFIDNVEGRAALDRMALESDDTAEQTVEEREETIARTKAWEKLSEMIPDFAEVGIAAGLAAVAKMQAAAKREAEAEKAKSNGTKSPKQATA